MSNRILVIGCGYAGLPLAQRLMERGHEVTGWVHSAETAASLAGLPWRRVVVGSVGDLEVWKTVDAHDVVIHCASSGKGGAAAYEEVFVRGAELIAAHLPQARKLMVSSTSVYGQSAGEIVTEESAVEPASRTSQILVRAEGIVLRAGGVVVRSSGIYGPGRGVLFDKFRRGEAVIEGNGTRWINMVHQADLVGAVLHLLDRGQGGEVYNVTDDASVTYLEFYRWCSEFLGNPMPPFGPVNPDRKRGLTNKRVANAKLRASGWVPQYPSFREGLAADYDLR